MLEGNKVHSNIDQESCRNPMVFLPDLKMEITYVLIVSLCFLRYLPMLVLYGIGNIFIHDDKRADSLIAKKCFHRQEDQQSKLTCFRCEKDKRSNRNIFA